MKLISSLSPPGNVGWIFDPSFPLPEADGLRPSDPDVPAALHPVVAEDSSVPTVNLKFAA